MAAPASPSSSPRLPSPPPFTEVQIGPESPSINATSNTPGIEAENAEKLEQGAERRVRPGTKAADIASGPPLKPLTEVDSAFQLQEHLKSLFNTHTSPPSSSGSHTTTPLTHTTALTIATPPPSIDRGLWLYELCRLLVIKANSLLISFFADTPPCSNNTCPEMRASEWQYLCAVHEPPKSCCAIDYSCHTLDWAATTLASQRHFPSRLTLGNESQGGSQAGVRQLTNIMRRVYRIFAHAWFQHRSVFWQVESGEGLYMLFKTVCDVYNLIPEDNYTIPPEAEGLSAKDKEDESSQLQAQSQANSTHKPPTTASTTEPTPTSTTTDPSDTTTTISTGATTRRHKSTHSYSTSVAAIAESDEEDGNKDASSPTKEKPTRSKTANKLSDKSEVKEEDASPGEVSGEGKDGDDEGDDGSTVVNEKKGEPTEGEGGDAQGIINEEPEEVKENPADEAETPTTTTGETKNLKGEKASSPPPPTSTSEKSDDSDKP